MESKICLVLQNRIHRDEQTKSIMINQKDLKYIQNLQLNSQSLFNDFYASLKKNSLKVKVNALMKVLSSKQ